VANVIVSDGANESDPDEPSVADAMAPREAGRGARGIVRP
jgi:hypothetical protein